MTPEEVADLNRRTAEALGWRWFLATVISEESRHRGQQHPIFMSPQDLADEQQKGYYDLQPCEKPDVVEAWRWRDVPDFCTDPLDADLVKAHMRAQGWHYRQGWGTDGGHAYVDTRDPDYIIGESYQQDTEEIALCLAFLAAHDATLEEKK